MRFWLTVIFGLLPGFEGGEEDANGRDDDEDLYGTDDTGSPKYSQAAKSAQHYNLKVHHMICLHISTCQATFLPTPSSERHSVMLKIYQS